MEERRKELGENKTLPVGLQEVHLGSTSTTQPPMRENSCAFHLSHPLHPQSIPNVTLSSHIELLDVEASVGRELCCWIPWNGAVLAHALCQEGGMEG